MSREPSPFLSANLICDYLISKFDEGSSSGTLNSIRSAINFFTLNFLDLEENIFCKRLFKSFYKRRPLKPRYTTFWPVSQLLEYLRSLHPPQDLSLKNLTLKTLALIALSSSDRGQTLHLASVNSMSITSQSVDFIVKERTKTTRRILKPITISCVSNDDESPNFANYVQFYINATKAHRGKEGKLFISWKTLKPVVRSSLARWLKQVLASAGIDTSIFKAHSYRGAGLSHALNKGATIDQIVKAGNWANASTFNKFYNAPSYDSAIGNIILND